MVKNATSHPKLDFEEIVFAQCAIYILILYPRPKGKLRIHEQNFSYHADRLANRCSREKLTRAENIASEDQKKASPICGRMSSNAGWVLSLFC